MIQKSCELLYLLANDTQHHWFYQLFWGDITQKQTSLNMVLIQSMFGTI